jgi:hypothetical protein
MLSAVGQLGGAIGMALLSVPFFNGLGASAGAAADDAAPRLRDELTEAGVPAPAQQPIVDDFRACFVDRTTAEDPEVNPPSCQRPGDGPAGAAVAEAATDVQRAAFVRSFRTAGYGVIGGLLPVVAITPLLPRRATPARQQPIHTEPDRQLLSTV